MEFVQAYAKDIVLIHEIMVEVWKINIPDYVKTAYDNAVSRGIDLKSAKNYYLTGWRLIQILKNMKESMI